MNWIKVTDSLPKIDVPVWLWENETIFIGCRSIYDGNWFWCDCYKDVWWNTVKNEWYSDTAEMDDDYKPTYWMTLPNPPK